MTTPDGRRVLLKDDQTWSYLEPASGEVAETARLELLNRKASLNNCRLGIKLVNELGYEIKSLVPQFTAVTAGGVDYQTVFGGFSSVKPGRGQYTEIEFTNIPCTEIAKVRVSGGDRCTMGELTKFSPEEGRCLAHVRVIASDVVGFSK